MPAVEVQAKSIDELEAPDTCKGPRAEPGKGRAGKQLGGPRRGGPARRPPGLPRVAGRPRHPGQFHPPGVRELGQGGKGGRHRRQAPTGT
eukprot:5034745-Alexandrium_andersonii.AAC.1